MTAPQPSIDAARLVSLAVAGDPAARRLLVQRLSRRVRSIALAILGNPADAEDAARAIFVEILAALGSYQGGKLFAWADRISVRTAARHAPQRRVRRARDAGVDPEEIASELAAPTEWSVPRPVVEYLRELPETRRVALVLRHVMGYSVDEIAELRS